MAIFVAELILLLFTGRMLGEGMARMGQPAIFGQLLAGVLLGPSVFGAFAPGLRQIVFPGTEALKSMLDAISQIGIRIGGADIDRGHGVADERPRRAR